MKKAKLSEFVEQLMFLIVLHVTRVNYFEINTCG